MFDISTAFAPVRRPRLDGATGWLGSEPLSPDDLLGRVVVFEFWTFTCINWLRTQPHVRAWTEAYRDDGLVVIGVHTPEFSFEHDVDRVRRAVEERDIRHPVVLDDGYEVWDAFANHYWPALYFVDREGRIRDHHFGEGRYEHPERQIQRLLGVERPLVSPSIVGAGVEAEADWAHLRTRETYLGSTRRERFAASGASAADGPGDLEIPPRLRSGHWALAGAWTTGPEHVRLERPGGRIAMRFRARDAHLVMSSPGTAPIPFRVRLDGEPPGAAHGEHVDAEGFGELRHGGLHHLVRQRDGVRDRTVEITFLERGVEACAFTFG
jgi:hypothetical protein